LARNNPPATGRATDQTNRKARDYNVGLPARQAAVNLLSNVLTDRMPLDDALINSRAAREMANLAERDRGLARAITSTTLRRLGQIDAVLDQFLDKKPPKRSGPLREILRAATCQLLFLDTPAHAAIDLAVTQCKQDRNARHFGKLANAVLRRVSEQGPEIVASQEPGRINTPGWLWKRWVTAYGEETARRVGQAHVHGATLDLTVKKDPERWAEKLNGIVLDTGTVRLTQSGQIGNLEGFSNGDWWVQDAGAALPVRLFGDVRGKTIADLCAAPGGKSAQLAFAGAHVTAVDISDRRLERVRENMDRLGLQVETVSADAARWKPNEKFDAVLLDAPCTGTGTIRRHPDIARLKSAKDLEELTKLQTRLLGNAVTLLRPGGTLVYCTCSLEKEEGEAQIAGLLKCVSNAHVESVDPKEVGGHNSWVTDEGFLRTLPYDLEPRVGELTGIDGFFAARIRF